MQTNTDSPVLDREPVVVDRLSRALYALATRVAVTDCTVLINGESGTGKEILARYIHDRSLRARQPFVAINCAAIPENMLEAMLFGYERGAFTGALNAHAGKFEQAQGGTLLLDEISEMPLPLQAKLLRVLQEREVERLGARAMMSLDVRVIATTNRDLRAQVRDGAFREDLFYRLCVFPMTIPALRERRDDVLPLAMRLLELRSPRGGRIPALSADAAQLLLGYDWPGNIRELDNLLQRAMILASGALIDAAHIHFETVRETGSTAQERRSGRPQRAAAAHVTACRREPDTAVGTARRCHAPRGRREAWNQPAHLAPQARAVAFCRRRRAGGLKALAGDNLMSNMTIDSVLAQIRTLQAQTKLGTSGVARPAAPDAAAANAPAADRVTFSNVLKQGLDAVNATQAKAADYAARFERGDQNLSLSQVMLQAQKADVSFRATVEVRNRLVNAYQEIMNMPI